MGCRAVSLQSCVIIIVCLCAASCTERDDDAQALRLARATREQSLAFADILSDILFRALAGLLDAEVYSNYKLLLHLSTPPESRPHPPCGAAAHHPTQAAAVGAAGNQRAKQASSCRPVAGLVLLGHHELDLGHLAVDRTRSFP